MSELDRYRLGFDSVAAVRERSRPQYAPGALAWIAQRLRLGASPGRLVRAPVEGMGQRGFPMITTVFVADRV